MVMQEGSGEEEGEEGLGVVIPGHHLLHIAHILIAATWTAATHSHHQAGGPVFGLGRWVVLRLATSLGEGTKHRIRLLPIDEKRLGDSRALVTLEKAALGFVRRLGSRLPLRVLGLGRADAGSGLHIGL